MIFKISKLKIIEIRQRNAFSIKNGMFLIYYIANLNFPGIPGKFPEYFGNSRSREIEIVREIPNPTLHESVLTRFFLLKTSFSNRLVYNQEQKRFTRCFHCQK